MATYPHLAFERPLWGKGYRLIAGLDEAGRGSWAGPVVAAAVILPAQQEGLAGRLAGVRDSKTLTPRTREVLYEKIRSHAVAVGVGLIPSWGIDSLGIVAATQLAMVGALDDLGILPDHLLIDALTLDYASLPQRNIVHGDGRSLSIACASIVAKVERDRMMREMAASHPGYGFEKHKGYGTREHRRALLKLGVSSIHRLSFRPMKVILLSGDARVSRLMGRRRERG